MENAETCGNVWENVRNMWENVWNMWGNVENVENVGQRGKILEKVGKMENVKKVDSVGSLLRLDVKSPESKRMGKD